MVTSSALLRFWSSELKNLSSRELRSKTCFIANRMLVQVAFSNEARNLQAGKQGKFYQQQLVLLPRALNLQSSLDQSVHLRQHPSSARNSFKNHTCTDSFTIWHVNRISITHNYPNFSLSLWRTAAPVPMCFHVFRVGPSVTRTPILSGTNRCQQNIGERAQKGPL